VYLVSLPDVAEETGGYYFKRQCRELSAAAHDAAARGSPGLRARHRATVVRNGAGNGREPPSYLE
jgi:hypothetical protein